MTAPAVTVERARAIVAEWHKAHGAPAPDDGLDDRAFINEAIRIASPTSPRCRSLKEARRYLVGVAKQILDVQRAR